MWIRTRKKMAYINIFPTFENDESWGAHQTNFHSTKSTGTPYMDCARYLYRSVRGSRLWFHSIRFSSTTLLPRYAAPVIKTRAYRCWPARPDQTRPDIINLYFTLLVRTASLYLNQLQGSPYNICVNYCNAIFFFAEIPQIAALHYFLAGIQFIDFTLLLLAILMPFPLPPAVICGFNFESSRETRLCQ